MTHTLRSALTLSGLLVAAHLFAQNNALRGRVLYQSSGNKPAAGVRVAEPDANAVYSVDNGDYRLIFQTKRNGAGLAIEVGPDTQEGKKIELVNEKELKAARLPTSAEEPLDIIVCPAGQRDIAAQRYYRILRTAADRELERRKKEVDDLLAQKEKDYQKISDLFALIDKMQTALDSANIREQAFNIAGINLDRASQMVKDAVKKIDEENDVEGALKILNAEALDTAYEHASALKKKADAAIKQVIEAYEFRISLLQPQFKYKEMAACYEKIAEIYEKEGYDEEILAESYASAAITCNKIGDYQKALELNLKALAIREKILPAGHPDLSASFNNVGYTYALLRQLPQAKMYFEKQQAIDSSGRVFRNWAMYYALQNDKVKAMECLEKAVDLGYNDLKWITTDRSLAGLRDWAAYKAIVERLQKQNPATENANQNAAIPAGINLDAYQIALDSNLALLAVREKKLPAGHPDLARLYNNIGYNYAKLRQFPQAKMYFEKFQAVSTSGRIFRNWAMYFALQNDKAAAIENLQKAVIFGYNDVKWITTDDSLESIRGERAYKVLVEQLKKG